MVKLVTTLYLAVSGCLVTGGAWALEVKVCALVQAKGPDWQAIPATALIDPGRLSFKKKVYLESRKEIPVWAGSVKRSLKDAISSLRPSDRKNLQNVLGAIEEWMKANLVEEPGLPPDCPAVWRNAARVLEEKRGNSFELVRAAVGMLRAAGVPARPTFDGSPSIFIYVTPRGKAGFWTIWKPLSDDAASRNLPVLWLPLRAEEVPLASIHPKSTSCRILLEGRRYADQTKARAAFVHCREQGRFPDVENWLPPLDLETWWEVWTIGAEVRPASETVSLTFPLPFVKDMGYGTREHAVWVSEPAALKKVSRMLSSTDQLLGGLRLSLKVWIEPETDKDADA